MAWAESRSRGESGGCEDVVVFLTDIAPLYTGSSQIDRRCGRDAVACILAVQFGRMSAHWPTTMKSYREELWFETKTRRAYLNITQQVEAAVKKSGVKDGLVLVNAMHITASVYINDD